LSDPLQDHIQHLTRVAALGCIICERPAEIHHIRTGQGKGQRAGDDQVLPLCPDHHRHGGYGVAIHAGRIAWECVYGTELELLDKVKERLYEEPDT
jgi:hypothetical protein